MKLERYDGKFNGENKIIFKNGNYIHIIYVTWKIKLYKTCVTFLYSILCIFAPAYYRLFSVVAILRKNIIKNVLKLAFVLRPAFKEKMHFLLSLISNSNIS